MVMVARVSRLEWSLGAAGPLLGADWQDFAACAEIGTELFFPSKGGDVRQAKRICAGCPVRAECLEEADANEGGSDLLTHGVWGGLSPQERIARFREAAA